jgi:flavodoxin
MSDILVVCFSRTGSTETVARAIAARLSADLDFVRPARSYRGPIGFFRGIVHSIRGARPPITSEKDPAKYRLVIVGAPVWASRLAAPMRTYLARRGSQIRSMAVFSVSGRGGRFEPYFAEVEALCGRRPTAWLVLSQGMVQSGTFEATLDPFVAVARKSTAERAA